MSGGLPLVSICLPVWNGAAYLGEALDSILQQTYTHFELLVQDDDSTDETPAVLARYSDPRLRVERNERQLGQVGALNRAISRASGDYVRCFSHDDRMLRGDLDAMVRCFQEHPDVGLSFSTSFRGIDADGRYVGSRGPVPEQVGRPVLVASTAMAARLFYQYGCLLRSLSLLMISRAALATCGAFNPEFVHHLDWELCARVAERYPIGLLAEPLCEIRSHPGQFSRRADMCAGMRETYALLEQHARHLPPDFLAPRDAYRRRTHGLRQFRTAVRSLMTGRVQDGARLLAEIGRQEPLAEMGRLYLAYIGQRLRHRLRHRPLVPYPYACEE